MAKNASRPKWLLLKKDGKTVNKAGSIKEFDKAFPGTAPKEVKEAFKEHAEVTDADIQNARNKGDSTPRAASNGKVSHDGDILQFVVEMGSVADAIKALEEIDENPASKIASKCGGAANVIKRLQTKANA